MMIPVSRKGLRICFWHGLSGRVFHKDFGGDSYSDFRRAVFPGIDFKREQGRDIGPAFLSEGRERAGWDRSIAEGDAIGRISADAHDGEAEGDRKSLRGIRHRRNVEGAIIVIGVRGELEGLAHDLCCSH